MSTKAKSLAAARKMKDRWRSKQWYRIIAPQMFNLMQLGETPAEDPSLLEGRTLEATVQDLTGDFSKMHIKLKFQVHDIRGLDAHTIFVGHDFTTDYVRRQTRRRRSKTDAIVDVVTKDGWELRLKPMSISEQRIQSSQRTALRNLMTTALKTSAAENTIGEFVKMIVSGDLSKHIANITKPIVPLKRVEIRKSEVKKVGTVPEITEVTEEPSAEEEQVQEEAPEGGEETEEAAVVESEELSEEELAREAEEKEE